MTKLSNKTILWARNDTININTKWSTRKTET